MDKERLKKLILKNKSKGVVYILEHYEVIKKLIAEGEKPGSIYKALKESDNPPPICRSQFYRNLDNYKLTEKDVTASSETPFQQVDQVNESPVNPKHIALNRLNKTEESIHNSGTDVDKLI